LFVLSPTTKKGWDGNMQSAGIKPYLYCMKLFFMLLLLSVGPMMLRAQKVEYNSHFAGYTIGGDGVIENADQQTVGYITGDWVITDPSHKTIGYVRSDGSIEDADNNTVGYVQANGTVETADHNAVGYILSDGTVLNARRQTIGNALNVKPSWAAVAYFFFKAGK
jgi:hypothetical protein